MDVEMQMETNGLPSEFGSTSDQPLETHVASNVAATAQNSATAPVVNGTKLTDTVSQDGPASGSFGIIASTKPPESVTEPPSLPIVNSNNSANSAKNNGASSIPGSQPQQVQVEQSTSSTQFSDAGPISQTESSATHSIIPSSIPTEILSSASTTEVTKSMIESATMPLVVPAQAPTSDLRTSPHANALPLAVVAQIEDEKHRQDSGPEVNDEAAPSDAMDISAMIESNQPVSVSAKTGDAPPQSEQTTASGLLSPPAPSPPPAPQPAPATLPEIPTSLPAEQPAAPAPTPVHQKKAEVSTDQSMTDAPSPVVKVARVREEDQVEAEPAAKRIRTDASRSNSEQAEFKVPEVPTANSPAAQASPPETTTKSTDDSVTQARLAHMKRVISNLKKSNASGPFRLPVDTVVLNIPTYYDIIKKPMDLSKIDNKLKANEYTSVKDFVDDFGLIVSNCLTFNGESHQVSQSARKMKSSFDNQMQNLPKTGAAEPTKEDKKAMKKQEPIRSAPPRRPSVTTTLPPPAGSARSPKTAATPTQSFAPGPDGVPLIRRDSNMNDGRPKRAIVPPKRNHESYGARPKKKKYELQLRFCQEVVKELVNSKHWQINQYFTHPVDPVALNIPTYYQIIKKPMDLGTIQTNLDNNNYEKAKDFEEDVRLVFKNCYKFNPAGDFVNNCGHQLEELFNKKWATKDDWIAAREPTSEPATEIEDEDEDDAESAEEEEEDSDDERNGKIKQLQKQIEMMSKQMGELTQGTKKKKKSRSPAPNKKSKSKSGKKDKATSQFPGLASKEKKKSTSKAKPEKDRYVTFAEKQYISNGIAMLPEKQMQEALKIIQNSVPSLANTDQNEIELDIEEVPNHALLKLLNFVKKYAGPPPDEPKRETEGYSAAPVPATGGRGKKNKPMSKQEQEAQIEELKGKLGAYSGGGALSPDAVQSIENGDSSDEGDSEESEEE